MNKFTIQFSFDAVASVEVLANSEEEARSKAREIELELDDYEFQVVYESVESIETIPDLQELIRKAGDIIKRYEKSERKTDFYTVPCYPTITTQVWNGDDYIKHKNLVEDFYWGPTDEITMDIGEGFEVALSELPEIEQLEVCQLIINAENDNL